MAEYVKVETDGRVANRWLFDCTGPASSGTLRFSTRSHGSVQMEGLPAFGNADM